tara:strand:- start:45 stop:1217 length:1173 start_codon:yes stop_codon:yes gene_type:complete
MEENNPLGLGYTPTFGDAVQGAVNYAGGVVRFYQKAVPQFLTGVRRGIKEEAEAPSPITDTRNPIQAAGELTTAYSQAEAAALEKVASGVEALGLPEPVAGAAALAVSPFIPGPAEAGLIMKGGTAMMGLTITDPRFLKGMTPGIADLPENRAAIDQLEKNLENIANRRAALTEKYADDPSRLQRKLTKLKKEEDGVISTLENMPGEKVAYGRKPAISVDPTEPTRLNVKGEVVPNPAHQHHMAGKAQTGAFVKAMREVGDDDDLIAMHSHIRRVLNSMGNVDANMLDIPGKGHIAMKGATETQRARNVHSLFDLIEIEPSSKAVQQYIGDVKNADELMDRFNTYISEYMKPQKELAIKITKKYLADHRKSLSPKDLQAYDDLVSKLSGL